MVLTVWGDTGGHSPVETHDENGASPAHLLPLAFRAFRDGPCAVHLVVRGSVEKVETVAMMSCVPE